MKTQKMFYSVSEVAEMLGVSSQTIMPLIHNGKLKAIRVGRNYRIAIADFNTAFGNTQQMNIQTVAQQPATKEVKTLSAQIDAARYFWLSNYRDRSGLQMQQIMNECMADFREKVEQSANQRQVINPLWKDESCDNKTINGKYSLLD